MGAPPPRPQNKPLVANQYFMGGAMDWEGFHDRNRNVECKHIIPGQMGAFSIHREHNQAV